MDTISVLLIALGLSMDAFAVSITSGITAKRLNIAHALRIALFFGLFQAMMPVLGWLAGNSVRDFIEHISHWFAFGLLAFIGVKMLIESRKLEDERTLDPLNIYVLLVLSVATSIDALAVGLSLAFLHVPIITPSIVIGLITFFMSYSGVCIGKKVGHLFERKIEVLGGLILIGIGLKILLSHYI